MQFTKSKLFLCLDLKVTGLRTTARAGVKKGLAVSFVELEMQKFLFLIDSHKKRGAINGSKILKLKLVEN